MTNVNSQHPLYQRFVDDWQQMRDTYEGERTVKQRGMQYLPATSGMIADSALVNLESTGAKAYSAYRMRARFPDLVTAAVEAMLGVMHNKPPMIELPPALEPMLEKATLRGESLEMLLRRINEEQLVVGRCGILLDVLDGVQGPTTPYIAFYQAEAMVNWDVGQRERDKLQTLNLLVLDESEQRRKPKSFEWEEYEQHRVLVLGDIDANERAGEKAVYRVAVVTDESGEFNDEMLKEPSIAGRKLERIPFEFVNVKDVVAEPDRPPLIGLSNLCLTIYRGEADYRQSLFMQGQDTLVIIGGDANETYRTGGGAAIALVQGSDAKYIGVDSQGLSEQRQALENDTTRAQQRAGELINETSRERESGDALRIRVAARTTTLTNVAIAGAFALQSLLRSAAEWVGADPEKVVVTPNLDFVDDRMEGKELVEMMTAKSLGAPLSLESIHKTMHDRGMTELTWDEELQKIEDEKALELAPPASTNPDGPADDPDQVDDPDSPDDDEGADGAEGASDGGA
jgi:hypothetical protein